MVAIIPGGRQRPATVSAAVCHAMAAAAASGPSVMRRAFHAAAVTVAAASAAASASVSALVPLSSGAAERAAGSDAGRQERVLPAVHAWVRRGSWRAARGWRWRR